MSDEFKCASDKCLVHMQVIGRLDAIERDIEELRHEVRTKAGSEELKEKIETYKREIEELKQAILRLNKEDSKHSEALARIAAVMEQFKETQDMMRQDYKQLAEVYSETSKNIAVLANTIQRQSKGSKDSEIPSDSPWYLRMVAKNPWLSMAAFAFVMFIIIMIASNWGDIIALLNNIFGK